MLAVAALGEGPTGNPAFGDHGFKPIRLYGTTLRSRFDRDQQARVFAGPFLRALHEIHAAIQVLIIDAGITGVEQEDFAVHGRSLTVGSMSSRADPVEVADVLTIDYGMNVRALWSKALLRWRSDDGFGQRVRRIRAQSLVDVGQ